MSKESYRIRVREVRTLKVLSKKTWRRIANECGVLPVAITRWLNGKKASIDHIIGLANALNTTAEKIILQEGEIETPGYSGKKDLEDDLDLEDEKVKNGLTIEVQEKPNGIRRAIIKIQFGSQANLKDNQEEIRAFYRFLRTILPDGKEMAIIGLTSASALISVRATSANLEAIASDRSEELFSKTGFKWIAESPIPVAPLFISKLGRRLSQRELILEEDNHLNDYNDTAYRELSPKEKVEFLYMKKILGFRDFTADRWINGDWSW